MNRNSRRKFIKTISIAGLLSPLLHAEAAGSVVGEASRKQFQINQPEKDEYLSAIKAELGKEWPSNRTVNLVFHGHSVPSGYFVTPDVKPLQSYPFLLLK